MRDNNHQNKDIGIGFVTYKSENSLIDRIQLTISLGYEVYLYDNSPQNNALRDFCRKHPSVTYITSGKNLGLGYGIATICATAYYSNLSALVFFDQDTIFNSLTLDFIEKFHISQPTLVNDYSSIVFNSKKFNQKELEKKFEIKNVLLSISSGSLFYLDNLKKINWHNHSYFVDCVDYEFCLNSNNNKFLIGECPNTPGFDHISEQVDSKYMLFGKERMLRKYSASRIADTTIGSLRLTFKSLITMNFSFAYAIIRSLAIYLNWQLTVRLLNIFR